MAPPFLEQALQVAPFHRWLGVTVVAQGGESVSIEMPWRDEMISSPKLPAMHGGIVAALIDLTGFYTVLASGNICASTADLHVDYHRAASRETIVAHGKIVRVGKRLSVAEVKVEGQRGLIASGRGAYTMKAE